MCYSSLVERALSKLARRMRAKIQTDAFVDLYAMRVRDPSLKIPLGMDSGLIELGGSTARSIEQSIKTFRAGEETRIAQQLEDLHAEIKEIEARLKVKMTKTQQEALAVKLRKRDKLVNDKQTGSVEGDSYRI